MLEIDFQHQHICALVEVSFGAEHVGLFSFIGFHINSVIYIFCDHMMTINFS